MRALRRRIHAVPGVLYEEHNASRIVREALQELGIPYRHPVAVTGVVAEVGHGEPIVILRADLDGLPVREDVEVPFRSEIAGKMHACGHDAHSAMLLGAAKILKERADAGQLRGTVRLVWQPAEEGGAGAARMISEGAAEGASAAAMVHTWSGLPTGVVASRGGPIAAASGKFVATIRGAGGHAAQPRRARDPVVAAAALVQALQLAVSRLSDPLEPVVLSVTRLVAGGGALNVIPNEAVVGGSFRAMSKSAHLALRSAIERAARTIADAHGCEAELDFLDAAVHTTALGDTWTTKVRTFGVCACYSLRRVVSAGRRLTLAFSAPVRCTRR